MWSVGGKVGAVGRGGEGRGVCVCVDSDLDLGADPKTHRTPGEEHDGVPYDSADGRAMPCEMHTPGPRWTFPSSLGPGAVPRAHSARHAECSRLHPEARPVLDCTGSRNLSLCPV